MSEHPQPLDPRAPHGAHGHDEHHGPTFQVYMLIALALAVFTASSFGFNALVRAKSISPTAGFVLILTVAVCKAVLVGMFFMHLKYDWSRLYFIIVPIFIMATMMMIVLLPDIVLAWHRDPAVPTAPQQAQQ